MLAACGSTPQDFDTIINFRGPRFQQDPALLATFQEMAKAHVGPAKAEE